MIYRYNFNKKKSQQGLSLLSDNRVFKLLIQDVFYGFFYNWILHHGFTITLIKARKEQNFVSVFACVKQNDWPQSLHRAHFDTQYQSRQITLFQTKFSNIYWLISYCLSCKDFYLATNPNFVLRCFFFFYLTAILDRYALSTYCTVYRTGSMQRREACS